MVRTSTKLAIVLLVLGCVSLTTAQARSGHNLSWQLSEQVTKATAKLKRTAWRDHLVGKKARRLAAIALSVLLNTSPVAAETQYSHMRGGDVVFYGGVGRSFLDEDTGAYVPQGYPTYERFGDIFNQPTNIVNPTNLVVLGLGWRPFYPSTLELKVFNYHSKHDRGLGYESGIDEWLSDNEAMLNLVATLTHQLGGIDRQGLVGPFAYAPLSLHLGPSYNYFGIYNSIDGEVVGYGEGIQGKLGLTWQVDFDFAHFWHNRSSIGLSYVGTYAGKGAQLHFVCLNICTAIIDF